MSDDVDSFDDFEDSDFDNSDMDDGRDDAKDGSKDDRLDDSSDDKVDGKDVVVDSNDVAAAILNALDRNADKEGDDGLPVFGDVNSSDSRG